MFEPAKRSKQAQRIFRYERNEEKMQQLKSTQRRKHPTKTIHQHCHSHKPSRRLWFTQKKQNLTFSTGKQLRAFILHQRRSTALCLFTISLSNAQAFPFHTLLEIARRNSSRDSLHFTSPRSPRVVRSDPIRSEHNTFNTTLPSVRPSFRWSVSPEGLTVKYIFVMVACPCPGWFWQLNSATNTPPDHRPR